MDASLQLSALQLEGYYVTELTYKVRPSTGEPQFHMQGSIGVQHIGLYQADPLTIDVQAAATQHPQDLNRWQNVLTISSQNPPERKYPYDFQITLVGYFTVSEQVPAERREGFVKVNGASILYSAARELLATVTGRGPLPSVVLPTVVFVIPPEQKQLPKRKVKAQAGGGKKPVKKPVKKGTTKKTGAKKQQR